METRLSQALSLSLILMVAISAPMALGGALEDGKVAIARGDYAAAIAQWSRLIASADATGRSEALIRRGEAYRRLGHYRDARNDFDAALVAASQSDQAVLETVATQQLGHVAFLERDFAEAERLLSASLQRAKQLRRPELAAASANLLGSVQFNQGRRGDAEASYRQALTLARQASDNALAAAVHRNLARLAIDDEQALAELRRAWENAAEVESPDERVELLLGIGVAARERQSKAGLALSYDALGEAVRITAVLDAPRLRSLATGNLAAWYESQDRLSEARTLTEQAIVAAQGVEANDLLLKWEWQLGRLLRSQGDRHRAIAAYRRAVYAIQSIRQDIPIEYHDGRSSFRDTLGPIYLGLADLLLQQAADGTNPAIEQASLREARDAVEWFKASELRDYLNDPCIMARTEAVESLSPTTAVLYPIVFSDRLELLVSIADRVYRAMSPVERNDLRERVDEFVRSLRETDMFIASAAKDLYDPLIRPIASLLEEHDVDTLVFVPDGPLRLVPFAALWDGERYLVQRYAVAVSPGLNLLEPRPLFGGRMNTLLAGLSRPGPEVAGQLPGALQDSLLREPVVDGGLRRRGSAVTVDDLRIHSDDLVHPRIGERAADELVQRLELPGVREEIEQLAQQLPGKVLLDNAFALSNFVHEVEEEPFRVVHIASHGFFGGTEAESFILTYDKKLRMSELQEALKPRRLADRPLELLALSACQTAEGDDRTPLGLSGVALKSGARSVLGSLWSVYDVAARRLLPTFYDRLGNPGVTRAEALREAQLDLLKDEALGDPMFWAPFILVGSWL